MASKSEPVPDLLNRKDRKALNSLNEYLAQRSNLVLNRKVVSAATFQRLEHLRVLAERMEVDDSPAMSICGHKIYAWELQDIARELQFLLNEL